MPGRREGYYVITSPLTDRTVLNLRTPGGAKHIFTISAARNADSHRTYVQSVRHLYLAVFDFLAAFISVYGGLFRYQVCSVIRTPSNISPVTEADEGFLTTGRWKPDCDQLVDRHVFNF